MLNNILYKNFPDDCFLCDNFNIAFNQSPYCKITHEGWTKMKDCPLNACFNKEEPNEQ